MAGGDSLDAAGIISEHVEIYTTTARWTINVAATLRFQQIACANKDVSVRQSSQ